MSKRIPKNFKENLLIELERAGSNQKELAVKMNMDSSTLNNKLNGKRPFNEEDYDEICKILNVERCYMEQPSEVRQVALLVDKLLNQNSETNNLRLFYTKQIIDCDSDQECNKVFKTWNKERQISELVLNHPSGVAIIAVALGIGSVLSLSQNIILQSIAALLLTSLGVFMCSSFSSNKRAEKIVSITLKIMFAVAILAFGYVLLNFF